MNEHTAEQPADEIESEHEARWSPWGCALRVTFAMFALLALAFVVTVVGSFLDDTDNPEVATTINVGSAEGYEPGSVIHYDVEHIFVVRLAGGEFIALYDKSPQQQERLGDCRVRYDEDRLPAGLDQLPGMEGALVEVCNELTTIWRVDGQFASGTGYGNLDRFETSIDQNGDLLIDISERTCTRSRGVPGIPPYDETTCGPPHD